MKIEKQLSQDLIYYIDHNCIQEAKETWRDYNVIIRNMHNRGLEWDSRIYFHTRQKYEKFKKDKLI